MIIPKETQALERLKNTLLAEGYWQDALEDVSIIENALNNYYRLLKEDNETTKKLKALEIIKKDIGLSFFETTEDNTLDEIHYYINIGNVCAYRIPIEEYVLLKEVLL